VPTTLRKTHEPQPGLRNVEGTFALDKKAAEQAKRFRNSEADPVAILYEVERISGSTRLSFEVGSLHENF
jgi:hypothetical protein